MAKKFSLLLVATALIGFITAISGCSTISYYGHVAKGHVSLLSKRDIVDKLLQEPELDSGLRRQLSVIKTARQFAVDQLQLPDNDSYLKYADLGRPYVVWNVFAVEELSLSPKQHCFPVAGCVVYRGYFNEEAATAAAEALKSEGYDVHVGGVAAYSTLGWFDDPILNTMLRWEDWVIVQLILHELSHQKLYVKNDSAFNEALATAAARLGLEQWLEQEQQTELVARIEAYRTRQAEFNQLLLNTREKLATLYNSDQSRTAKRKGKTQIIAALSTEYETLKKQQWNGWAGFDRWFEKPINNARLLPVATYNQRVPEFLTLFEECAQDWSCFWDSAAQLASPQ